MKKPVKTHRSITLTAKGRKVIGKKPTLQDEIDKLRIIVADLRGEIALLKKELSYVDGDAAKLERQTKLLSDARLYVAKALSLNPSDPEHGRILREIMDPPVTGEAK